MLLSTHFAQDLDWRRIKFLIGDERCVPLDNPDSSWLSILPLFQAHPEIPVEHQLRPQSQLPAEQAAELYAASLMSLAHNASNLPILDHLWLGIGEDGHTLSLFPGHPSSQQNSDQLVKAVHDSPKPPPDRITFTYKTLAGVNSAVAFITGASKAEVVARIAAGDHSLPIVVASQAITAAGGHVTWLVDREALAQVPDDQTLRLG
jgi:6-phosphogluconolactonase